MGTLFGQLAFRFTNQIENLATEALGYILGQSEAARTAVTEHVRRGGLILPSGLIYSTQVVGESDERPDLVGRSSDGREPLLVEAKFWAGLTANQPVTYLTRLPAGGVLLFIVPEARIQSMWAELDHLCVDQGVPFVPSAQAVPGMRVADVELGKHLVLTSWRGILADIRRAVEGARQPQLVDDVVQLQGLCDRIDTDAFLPLSREELTCKYYRRIFEFGPLAEDAVTELAKRGVADKTNLGKSSGFGFSGRYFRLSGANAFLGCDLRLWVKYGITPLWLTVYGDAWDARSKDAVRSAIGALAHESPPRVFDDANGLSAIAIPLPVGVGRDAVVAAIAVQVEGVAPLVARLAPAPSAGTPEVPPASGSPEGT